MKIISRKDAKAQGLKRYFTGKPCKYGHVAERFVSSPTCVVCKYEYGREWQNANREKVNAYSAKWNRNNVDKRRASVAEWRRRNPEKHRANVAKHARKHSEHIKEYQDNWRRENRDRTRKNATRWAKENRSKRNAAEAKRHAAKIQRTPAWADQEAINFFYECCPAGCHVDHIVPLQGKYVSGLHVAENLQWLPAQENLSKKNSFDTGG